jgi:hypothetical protein
MEIFLQAAAMFSRLVLLSFSGCGVLSARFVLLTAGEIKPPFTAYHPTLDVPCNL